jgi:hypothetical protein
VPRALQRKSVWTCPACECRWVLTFVEDDEVQLDPIDRNEALSVVVPREKEGRPLSGCRTG